MMKKNSTIQKTFTRRTYQKGNTCMISIPIEITRDLEISSETSFVVQLIDGMIIYKPINMEINSKSITKNIKSKKIETAITNSDIPEENSNIKDDEDLLTIIEDDTDMTTDDSDIDVEGVEEI